MGRQNKGGLDYFELDCYMDDKVRLIQAEYGLVGFAVFIRLLQDIYRENGYYCEWTSDKELLFASENGMSETRQLLRDIVDACIRRDIFSKRLFDEYGILTSTGVQKQYVKATAKREVVSLKKEYLLIEIPPNRKNVVINAISSNGNAISYGRNTQSREEYIKEEYIMAEKIFESDFSFQDFISAYPKGGNNFLAETQFCKLLVDDCHLTAELLVQAAKNYADACKILGTEERFVKAPQNFLNDNYFVSYLPGNYKAPKKPTKKNKLTLVQNEYDFDELERELMCN